jgi:anti-sigma factor RsiW
MKCSSDLIHAYLDGELKTAMEEHLATCQTCSEILAALVELKADIRSQVPYYTAPKRLEQPVRIDRWRWAAIAATALLAVSVTGNVVSRQPKDLVTDSVLSDHIRSLMGTHLLDVESTDRHTVKPWFNGKLDFSPEVRDFATEGFPLAGGRLEYLAGRPVAALVYRRRQHVVTLFTWPASAAPATEGTLSRHGFQVVHWTAGEMTNWAVGDIPLTELEQFKALIRK